jgi:ring-1,2-phenylacetyl-CoA epoxidase subunit PaaE
MLAYKNNTNKRGSAAPAARRINVQVVRREVLMDGVVRLSLALPGTIHAPAAYLPGQFITLTFQAGGQAIYRSYSLCGSGQTNQPWVITIKRQQHGLVSAYLYAHVREGMQLQASLPQGSFVLPARLRRETPLIFVAAGSGITPIIGMLRALALLSPERRPAVHLHYASRTPAETIYLRELEALDPQATWLRRSYYFSAQGTRLTPLQVVKSAGHQTTLAHWYICGPTTLKRDLQKLLAASAVPAQQVHTETFASPAQKTAQPLRGARNANGTRIRVKDTGAVLQAHSGETLLATLERHGYAPEYSCRAGACGTCKLRLLSGKVHPAGDSLSAAERQAGYALACVAHPASDVTIASAGQPPTRHLASAGSRHPNRRQGAIKRVRALTAVAAVGLVVSSWGLIHSQASGTAAASTSSSNSQSSNASQGDDSSSSSSNNTTSGSSDSGSSTFPAPMPTTQSGTS